ncbi:MAG: hypothetical protein BMS9Abin08_1075 [Gammaproteobacteria bacterium]|nr:MAG: hypothetical protein BMS9Abin08_1075 [Gammaproteobacteria bacterium]
MLKTRKALINSSYRRRPVSSALKTLDHGIRRDDHKCINQSFPEKPWYALFTSCVILLLAGTSSGLADGNAPYPAFVASYDANVNGLDIGNVQVSLTHEGGNEYLYRQESVFTGIAILLGNGNSTQNSRWRYQDNRIQVIDYRSRRRGGDDDDNEHLIFDWKTLRVSNTGAGEHWEIPLPEDAIDRLIMQLAMLFDLRAGKTDLRYVVPRQGRIKIYEFGLVGEETLDLESGSYRTLKIQRENENNDKSLVWIAPELNYFPVRFLKHKKSGVKIELVLRKLEFLPGSHNQGIDPDPENEQ